MHRLVSHPHDEAERQKAMLDRDVGRSVRVSVERRTGAGWADKEHVMTL
jgi:hypothetical protein